MMSAQRWTKNNSKSFTLAKAENKPKHSNGGHVAVGTYKMAETGKDFVMHKGRCAAIFPYKTTRYTDDVMKSKKWVPGPGSYQTTQLI